MSNKIIAGLLGMTIAGTAGIAPISALFRGMENVTPEQVIVQSREQMDDIYSKRPEVKVKGASAHSISVCTIKVAWTPEDGREYHVNIKPADEGTGYEENIFIDKKEEGLYYINGLRENTRYKVTVTPKLKVGEWYDNVRIYPYTTIVKTEEVEVVWDEYEYEEGWTSCFCGERASGLTLNPSWSAIQGCSVDKVTNTGIMRDEYGDYCVAMGVYYGYCWDRFLVELENGIQFTVKICDSKGWADDGDGKYHWYGGEGNGKCVVEFIYDDNSLPSCVAYSGSWGFWNWNGLNLGSNIKSIKKINYGEPVKY